MGKAYYAHNVEVIDKLYIDYTTINAYPGAKAYDLTKELRNAVEYKYISNGIESLILKINPKGTSLSGLTKGRKAITVKWKKQITKMSASRITGYEIRYSTYSKMKGAKTETVKGYSKISKKINKLKAKKKYYVQVRTYKTIKGIKYYSEWSAKKSVKIK